MGGGVSELLRGFLGVLCLDRTVTCKTTFVAVKDLYEFFALVAMIEEVSFAVVELGEMPDDVVLNLFKVFAEIDGSIGLINLIASDDSCECQVVIDLIDALAIAHS